MENLKRIYAKDIDREIQGVIKVDDESYISQELEEYVVTDELLKHFNSFFEAYNAGINSNTEKMGVWISGFFGSGKSHFNEKMGLSITPFVAEIERFIISQGKYEEFKEEFKNICGQPWEEMRDGIQFVQDEFSKAYSNVLGKTIEEANEVIDRTEKNYSLSVEKFAERVRDYIKTIM